MLNREVMIDEKIYTHHELTQIILLINDSTVACIKSTTDDEEQEPAETFYQLPWKDGQLAIDVENTVWDLPEFVEYRDTEALLDEVVEVLTDEQAIVVPDAFRKWRAGTEYKVGDRCRDGSLYKCVQAHTSQEGWEPHATPALWVTIAEPGTIPEWVQPAGSHDAYNTGDHVMHNGSEWVSTMDANVYEPGVYGWDEVGGE